MSKKLVVFIVLLVVVLLGIIFLSRGGQEIKEVTSAPEATLSPPTPSATPSPTSSQNTIIYTESGFSPSFLTIQGGEAVVFENQSSVDMWPASAFHPTHTVYSGTSLADHCPDEAGVAFDACAAIPPGGSWTFTFNKVGSWKYHDHLNPGHTGTITVE